MKSIWVASAVIALGLTACSSGSSTSPASSSSAPSPTIATTAQTCTGVNVVLTKELPNPSTKEQAQKASEQFQPIVAAAGPEIKTETSALNSAIDTVIAAGGTDAMTEAQKTELGNAVVGFVAVCEKAGVPIG